MEKNVKMSKIKNEIFLSSTNSSNQENIILDQIQNNISETDSFLSESDVEIHFSSNQGNNILILDSNNSLKSFDTHLNNNTYSGVTESNHSKTSYSLKYLSNSSSDEGKINISTSQNFFIDSSD